MYYFYRNVLSCMSRPRGWSTKCTLCTNRLVITRIQNPFWDTTRRSQDMKAAHTYMYSFIQNTSYCIYKRSVHVVNEVSNTSINNIWQFWMIVSNGIFDVLYEYLIDCCKLSPRAVDPLLHMNNNFWLEAIKTYWTWTWTWGCVWHIEFQ